MAVVCLTQKFLGHYLCFFLHHKDTEEGGEKKDDKVKKEVKKEGKEGKEGGSGKQGGAAPPAKDSRESEIIRNLKSEHK